MPENELVEGLGLDEYQYGFVDEEAHVFRTRPGLDEDIVREISKHKDEPEWMLEFRLKALKIYESKPMPTWGGDLSDLEATLDEIYFYVKPQNQMERSWDDVPDNIKNTFERLGIPEAEQKLLAGVGAQYESEMVYHSLKEEWAARGGRADQLLEEQGIAEHGLEQCREHEDRGAHEQHRDVLTEAQKGAARPAHSQDVVQRVFNVEEQGPGRHQ